MMRQRASPKDHGICSGETVLANLDGLRRLAACCEIDAVRKQLRAKTTDGREGAYAHPGGTVDQMPAANSGVSFNDEFGSPVRLVSEVPARATRKTCDPVELSDDCMRAEAKQIDVFAKGEVTDARAFFHHKMPRENPGEADAARGMNRIAELLFEQGTTYRPRQKHGNKPKQRLHDAGASVR
ncbi:MAG: hypothetical protein QOK03_1001 [Candidatus Binataceae bacterium]|nr:hypothetical protein [Candidatus Binataceae bacterium]